MNYKNEEFELIDELIDVGYMAEDIETIDLQDNELTIKKASPNRMIQIFLSFPNFEDFKEEIIAFDEFMNDAKVEIFTYIIFDKKIDFDYKFKKILLVFDINEDYGNMYGTKIINGTLENCLTKALFLVGKDGAIYHIDMPEDLSKPLDMERIRIELNKVYQSYTGVGCHG
jgi:peroxiredoxin|tara:strand:- start:41035 stop:41547 length:513 start_codon:yes stop_codon:yes gene_type:complete